MTGPRFVGFISTILAYWRPRCDLTELRSLYSLMEEVVLAGLVNSDEIALLLEPEEEEA